MKKIGDIISWETKSGKTTGEIVRIDIKYTVLIEPERKKHMVLVDSQFNETN